MTDPQSFSTLAADSSKNSIEFGKKLLMLAYERWNNGTSESASGRQRRYEYNRSYARGKQDMQEFKDILDLDGEMSVINLDFSPTPIAIPFINRLIDRYMQRIEKIQANAIDPLTQSKKEKARNDAKFKLRKKDSIIALQQESGVELEEFKEDDPQDEKEIDIQFGFTYKEREEVVMEQGLDLIFYDNSWDKIKKRRILWNLITAGIAQTYTYIDSNGKIKIATDKPEMIVSSFTEEDNFEGATYQGHVFLIKISDIRKCFPDAVRRMGGEEQLCNLAIGQRGLNGNSKDINFSWTPEYNQAIARPYDGFAVQAIQLSFKTLNNLKYEINKDRFGKEVLDRKNVLNPEKPNLQSKPYDVEYTGIMLTSNSFVIEWKLAKNQVKNERNLAEVTLPYVTHMYGNERMTNTPLIETMIPSIKKMQLVELQQQKIIAAAAPDGYRIDISQMSDVNLGEGLESVTPFDLYKIYKQTGIQYYKRTDDSGITQKEAPITPDNVPFSAKLEQLMAVWNQEYDKLQKITGDNNLAAGNITNQAVANKTLQDAKIIGESASNYIYESYLDITERTARIAAQRLWDILVYKPQGERIYDGYKMALGEERTEYIRVEATDDFEKTNFDVKIQAVIDDKESMFLEQNIQVALSQKEITLEDAIDVRLLAKSNIKYASYMLSYRMKKRLREAQESAKLSSMQAAQGAIAGAQEKGNQDKELEILRAQLKSQGTVQEIDAEKSKEIIKFSSILKTKVIEGMLSQGKTIEEIQAAAPWVFDGVGTIAATTNEIMEENLMQLQQQEQQQMEQAPQEEQMTPPQEEMVA